MGQSTKAVKKITLYFIYFLSSVQLLSHVWPFATPWTAASQASLSITNSWSLFKLMSIKSVMPSNHLILCHPLLLPSIFPSIIEPFPVSQFFTSSGQSIAISASAPVLPTNIQDWFPLGWTGWISLQSKGLSRVFSSTTIWNHQFFSALYGPTLTSIHDHWKNHNFDFVGKAMSLLSNTVSSFVIAFLPRRGGSFNFMAAYTIQSNFGAQIKFVTISLSPHLFAMKSWDQMPWTSFFEFWVLSQLFHSPLSLSSRVSLVPLHFLPLEWYHLHVWGCCYFEVWVSSGLLWGQGHWLYRSWKVSA